MKKAVFIGNRLPVWKALLQCKEIEVVKVFVLKGSPLANELSTSKANITVIEDDAASKKLIVDYLLNHSFDLLFSNGCPFILPVQQLKLRQSNALFINTHPTFLPELKG